MALNDKLINYGNLVEFHNQILNDTGSTTGVTWSANKLEGELASKQDTLVAGDCIQISGNTISAIAIEEVSELPNASENKDKLFRLDNGEKDVYAAKLISTTVLPPTNRLPDEQQIDKAYIYQYGDIYYYKGNFKLICSDKEINGYGWILYYDNNWYFLLTTDNAENITIDSIAYGVVSSDNSILDLPNKTVDSSNFSSEYLVGTLLNDKEAAPIPATYNAPEVNQIGNATMDVHDSISEDFTSIIYTGDIIIYEMENWYKWNYVTQDSVDYNYIVTNKKASEMFVYYYEGIDLYCSDAIFMGYNGETYETITNDNRRNIYIPQLNAPDSEQVDNAYIVDGYNGVQEKYTGEETTIEINGDAITVYTWVDNITDRVAYSTKPAYQIYNTDRDSDDVHFYVYDGEYVELLFANGNLSAVSTVKYQRTEVIEEWGWEKVATEQYVDDAINISNESTFTGATLTVDGSQPSIVASGSTTIVWDDLSSSIPSGKSVEVSVVLINTGNSALTPTMQGNYQMMGDGNLTIQPLELGLYKAKYISAVDVWLVEAINQKVSGTME